MKKQKLSEVAKWLCSKAGKKAVATAHKNSEIFREELRKATIIDETFLKQRVTI